MLTCDDGSCSEIDDDHEKTDHVRNDSTTPGLLMYVSDGSEEYSTNHLSELDPMTDRETSTVLETSAVRYEIKNCKVPRKRKASKPVKEIKFECEAMESPKLTWSEQDQINFETSNNTRWTFSNDIPGQVYEKMNGLDYMSALNAPDHPDYYQVDDAHGAAVLKCAKCTKTFRTFQQLKQHMLVHSNIRKHSCHFCDKTFKQQCHLQQHERLHTGELPYKCDIGTCNKAFRQSSNLQLHKKMHICYTSKEFNPSSPHVSISAASPNLMAYTEETDCSDSTGMPDLLTSCLKEQTSKNPAVQKLEGQHHLEYRKFMQTVPVDSNLRTVTSPSQSASTSRMTSSFPAGTAASSSKTFSPAAYSRSKSSRLPSSNSRAFSQDDKVICTSSSRMNATHLSSTKADVVLPPRGSNRHKKTSAAADTFCLPVHQQSLMSLSYKLGEISRREEFLRLNTVQDLYSPFKRL